MANSRKRKARSEKGAFIQLSKSILKSRAYRSLTGNETKVFIHLCESYNGRNNGNLAIPYNRAEEFCLSRQTISNSLKSLEEKGFIELSRQGGKGMLSLYALTIFPIDDCFNQHGYSVHNLTATTQPKHSWKHYNEKLKAQTP